MNSLPPPIKLYGYPTSPYVMKVACYLNYKQLPFEFVPVNPIHSKEIKFTGQKQVPVMEIGDEWRKDSSPLGIWLDERFPDRPLLGSSEIERVQIMAIDAWVSNMLIPARFRAAVEWESGINAIRNGWILSRAVNDASPLPWLVRKLWPIFVRRAPFILDMVNKLDPSESPIEMHKRLANEMLTHLGKGPFLGGLPEPSLADFSAYPLIVSGYLMGMHGKSQYLQHEKIVKWCRRVQSHLPKNPLLVPDYLIERTHP
jgi:glutathione S-transferase